MKELFKNIEIALSKNEIAGGDIPFNLINEGTFICPCLARCIKEDLVISDFPDSLNLSNIIPIQEKKDPAGQITYRSVSVLSLVSKIFDKIMQEQLYEYLKNNYLNYLLWSFYKAHSTQYALSRFLQSLKEELDYSGFMETILMHLSKACHCLPHDLLIAKVEAWDLDKPNLNLVNDYFGFQKTKGTNSLFVQ